MRIYVKYIGGPLDKKGFSLGEIFSKYTKHWAGMKIGKDVETFYSVDEKVNEWDYKVILNTPRKIVLEYIGDRKG